MKLKKKDNFKAVKEKKVIKKINPPTNATIQEYTVYNHQLKTEIEIIKKQIYAIKNTEIPSINVQIKDC